MNEVAVIDRSTEPGLGTGRERRAGIYCPCMEQIMGEDIDRGYHSPCGRTITLVLGEPGSAFVS